MKAALRMDSERARLALYAVKCVLGLCLGYALYRLFPQHQFYWSIISILLVLAPDGGDSNKLAFERMAANVVGSTIGLLLYLARKPDLPLLCAGVVATIAVGTAFKLNAAIRSALVSLIIVMLNEQQTNSWRVALERIGCVIAGCAIAMGITFLFNYLFPMKNAAPAASGE
ncbi:MAG TPA: FUSC family protein [Fibrobacteria bacterium]|nr:FUSC family protein [Fibrobacteria bacterium]